MPRPKSILTIGTFDGVHRGHSKILNLTYKLSKKSKLIPCAVTFHIPPRLFFSPSHDPYLLTDVREKKFLMEKPGIKKVDIMTFNSKLAKQTAKKFFHNIILKKYNTQTLIVGYNFAFGKGREGGIPFLSRICKQYDIKFIVVPQIRLGSDPISSGLIRNHLHLGQIKEANRLLGHPYIAIGKVIHGNHLGKQLGFPTANIQVSPHKILPPGVYAVKVSIISNKSQGPSLKGMCNIGTRPTVNKTLKNAKRSFEVHIFNTNKQLYGKTLKIEFISKIRNELKFPNLQALKKQLSKDASFTLKKL